MGERSHLRLVDRQMGAVRSVLPLLVQERNVLRRGHRHGGCRAGRRRRPAPVREHKARRRRSETRGCGPVSSCASAQGGEDVPVRRVRTARRRASWAEGRAMVRRYPCKGWVEERNMGRGEVRDVRLVIGPAATWSSGTPAELNRTSFTWHSSTRHHTQGHSCTTTHACAGRVHTLLSHRYGS